MMAAKAINSAQQTRKNILKITTRFLVKRNLNQNLCYSSDVFHGESLVGLLSRGGNSPALF